MASGDNVVSCNNSAVNLVELLASAIGVNSQGKKYLRLKTTTAVPGSKAFPCGVPVDITNLEAELKNIFVIDSNGDIAIRVTTST